MTFLKFKKKLRDSGKLPSRDTANDYCHCDCIFSYGLVSVLYFHISADFVPLVGENSIFFLFCFHGYLGEEAFFHATGTLSAFSYGILLCISCPLFAILIDDL